MQNVTQIDMGVVESNIEIILNERDIKRLAIVCDDHFVFLNVLDKIVQVLPLHICFNLMTVINRNGCYIVEIAIQSCGFNIQLDRGVSEFWK